MIIISQTKLTKLSQMSKLCLTSASIFIIEICLRLILDEKKQFKDRFLQRLLVIIVKTLLRVN